MRESNSLEPYDTGFTDQPACFNGLITHMVLGFIIKYSFEPITELNGGNT